MIIPESAYAQPPAKERYCRVCGQLLEASDALRCRPCREEGAESLGYLLDQGSFDDQTEQPRDEEGLPTWEDYRRNVKRYELGDWVEVTRMYHPWGEGPTHPVHRVEAAIAKREGSQVLAGARSMPDDRTPIQKRIERFIMPPSRDKDKTESIETACRKARSRIRRLSINNNLRNMWTFTFAQAGISDLTDAWKEWSLFNRRMKRNDIMPEKWLVTPEVQKGRMLKYGDKVWHFHMITDQYIDIYRCQAVWKHGIVNVVSGNDGGEGASYISKYITKEAGEDADRRPGQHRYRKSDGLTYPDPTEYYITDEAEFDELLHTDDRVVVASKKIIKDGVLLGEWYMTRKRRYRANVSKVTQEG